MHAVIILPTYNEAANIQAIITAILEVAQDLAHSLKILVVDDNSPDGTGDIVKHLQTNHGNLFLLEGPQVGLGAAYLRGFRYVLEHMNADVIFQMDADFSHDPQDIPRLLAMIEQGADFVIGSRYVPGGKIPAEWEWWRKLISVLGNIVARYVAGLYRIRDCTAGFRAIRAETARKILWDNLKTQGYAFQVALLHAAIVNQARVVEVPVHFVDRHLGTSKLGLSDIIEFIINAWWIRFQASRTFIKFALVGASGVAVNLGTFTFLLHLGIVQFVASPLAIQTSILTNFFLNNAWTFRWRDLGGSIQIRGLKYNMVAFVALAMSTLTFISLSAIFPGVAPQWHQLAAIVPATGVNYFLNAYWTFKDRSA